MWICTCMQIWICTCKCEYLRVCVCVCIPLCAWRVLRVHQLHSEARPSPHPEPLSSCAGSRRVARRRWRGWRRVLQPRILPECVQDPAEVPRGALQRLRAPPPPRPNQVQRPRLRTPSQRPELHLAPAAGYPRWVFFFFSVLSLVGSIALGTHFFRLFFASWDYCLV